MSPVSEAEERLLEGNEHNSEETELQAFEATESNISNGGSHTTHRLLYISHFLSTWNSRVFEFGAFLFLANIFPDTLLPASVYALSRAASAAVFSPLVGSYIDRADRLHAVRLSIGKTTSPYNRPNCQF